MRIWILGLSTLVFAACSGTATTTVTATPTTPAAGTAITRPEVAPTSTTTQDSVGPSLPSTSTAGAALMRSVEVTIPADGLDLVGTLRLPAGEQPAPAVVLIHGSGPQSRDTPLPGQLNMAFGFEIPVFAEIAAALQENGLAVLTYDKRSCGPFNGCADNDYPLPAGDLTVEVFMNDAKAAVDFLRQRTEVEASSISIIGHSQGAQFITLMLEADPDLAGGIMLAGPYRSIDESITAQLDFTVDLLGQFGMDEAEALASPSVSSLVDMVNGLADIRSGSDDPVAGVSAGFWRSWFDLHERSLSAAFRMTQPLLVINGELDWNVAPTEAQAWAEYLAGVDAEYEVQILPCVTHALNCVSESDPTAITPSDIGRAVAPEVIDAIVAFVNR
ncbi:MAG: alpha/beta hydrolase [Acidimicrobiia bacterium]|nr:alpha/beta hydrolase [Acidimicrobiia bacterium]